MSKEATDRYNVKVEVPITILLETIFSDDNEDVESLCRWARKYGFVDLIEDEHGKYYKLQDDYNKQDFYIWLDKEERKQYDYENKLLDRIEELEKDNEEYKRRHNHVLGYIENCYSEPDYNYVHSILEGKDTNE